MTQADTLLTLIAPQALEEQLVDLLLSHPELAQGFTTVHVEGHGAEVALVGANENVRGRGRRICVRLAAERAAAERLLAEIREALPDGNIYFWMSALLAAGRLA